MNQPAVANPNKVGVKGFQSGNRYGVNSGGGNNATARELKQLCLKVLHENGVSGKPLIEEVIRNVSRDKPEALLPFAGKLIPQESEQVVIKKSPIVFTNTFNDQTQVGVVVEEKIIETNVVQAPIVVDTRPLIETHAIVNDKVVRKVLKSCSVGDEEL